MYLCYRFLLPLCSVQCASTFPFHFSTSVRTKEYFIFPPILLFLHENGKEKEAVMVNPPSFHFCRWQRNTLNRKERVFGAWHNWYTTLGQGSIARHEAKAAASASAVIFYVYSWGVEGQQCVKRFIEVYTPLEERMRRS